LAAGWPPLLARNAESKTASEANNATRAMRLTVMVISFSTQENIVQLLDAHTRSSLESNQEPCRWFVGSTGSC
jgi:hypothetical protein